METKEYLLLEIKKIINILSTWGNVLVIGYGDKKQVSAKSKLAYCVGLLNEDYNMSMEDIEKEIQK